MTRLKIAFVLACLAAAPLHAQWQLQNSGTTADLRGIHNVGNGIAWASGTNGTVLRTEDGGYQWQPCAIPPGAGKLDFRGIQAFDANTAIVMSSGPGDQSRLYKTTDGCQTWKLIFKNPDKDGFWDAISVDWPNRSGVVIGDPVGGHFALFLSSDTQLDDWRPYGRSFLSQSTAAPTPQSDKEALFAASNTSLTWHMSFLQLRFVTGGGTGAFFYEPHWAVWPPGDNSGRFLPSPIPLAKGNSGGAFSFAIDTRCRGWGIVKCALVAVGGDYTKPEESTATAAYSINEGKTWVVAQTPPHGYRSAVAYDESTKTWITVGPNGTDISTDDGKNWRPVHPDAALHEAPDADKNWNALSLPYVVGPKGRIGKLDRSSF